MLWKFIVLIGVTLVNLLVAGFVFFKKTNNNVNIFFGLMTLSISLWGLTNAACLVAADLFSAFFWAVLSYISAILIATFFLAFSLVFPPNISNQKGYMPMPYHRYYLFVFPIVVSLIMIVPGLTIKEIYLSPWRIVTGGGIFALAVFFLGTMLWSLRRLVKKYFAADSFEKLQIKYIFTGMMVSTVLGSFFNLILPLRNNYDFVWLGPVCTIFFIVITALAITKYHLFEIKVILTELVVGLMAAILFVLAFYMPTDTFKALTIILFVVFIIFGNYLIRATIDEGRRREQAELVAFREHELRKEAEILAADLKRLDGAKTQFLLSTQHHLRSPLSVIQGYLSMISEGGYGKISAEAREKIAVSLESTQKLIHLVNDLLDVAQFQMNKGVVAREPTDISKIITEIVGELEETARAKGIYLRFNPPETAIPEVNVDSRGIREAIYNIIDNAVKYTQEGGVTVSAAVMGGFLRISIADTGIGMNEKEQRGLFNRTFERGEKAKNVNINGKGIGLYLAGQMIAGNDGTVCAKSAGWGQGSEFIIELPLGVSSDALLSPAAFQK